MRKNTVYLLFILLLAFSVIIISYPKIFPIEIPYFSKIPFRLGLDLQGGVHLIYEADLSRVEKKNYDSAMAGLRDVIERRVNLFGIQEPVVQVQTTAEGARRLIVELAGVVDPAQAIEMIGQTPFLEFREERSEEETEAILAKQKEIEGKTVEEIQKIENWQLGLEDPYFKPTQLTGRYLERAELTFNQTTFQPQVSLQFNDEGAKLFKDLTEKNVGKQLAIYIDNILISAPVVQEPIAGGRAQITGNFTVEEAKKLARNLNAGALPVPITLISQQQVGPTLGAVSLEKSLKAGIVGFLLIILFMIVFYRLPGIISGLSLVIYVAIVLALFKLIPVTLTLAGIGGFILSIGMAVDANILIFSRMKEELKLNKGFAIALEEGFRRAWPSIRDGNLTTLIVALILFWFGSSFVQGFALALSIGIIISMFSAMFITKVFLQLFVGTRFEKYNFLWA